MGWKIPNVVVFVVTAILLLVTVETVLASVAAPAVSQQDFDSGADRGMKSLNIELIKLSILDKLGMQRPPEFVKRLPLQALASKHNSDLGTSTVAPPKIQHKSNRIDATAKGGTDIQSRKTATVSTNHIINNNNVIDDDDDYHVKTQKLIAFAQLHPTVQILRGQYALYFTFSEQTQHYRITKAVLWVYKRPLDVVIDNSVVVIDVYKVNPINLQQSLVSSIKRILNTTEPGWVSIELQRSMSDWFETTDEVKNLTLVVQAYYPNKNTTYDKTPYITDARKIDDTTEVPYLEVHTHYWRRNKRLAGSEQRTRNDKTAEHTGCRRYPVTMNFDELGWDQIIAPKEFEFYYCSGECGSTVPVHSPQSTSGREEHQCCVPRKTSRLSVLYLKNSTGLVDYMDFSNMIVDECACRGTDSIVRSLLRRKRFL